MLLPVKLTECPRDAMQGISEFIPTEKKIAYLNTLLQVGFDTLDFGSFVSPKAIPQMRDTAQVLEKLEFTDTKLLAIIANIRGAKEACAFDRVTYIGFPLSLSETFQQRNTNKSIPQAFEELKAIQELSVKTGKTLVVYLSMGFGNPYNDAYTPTYLQDFVARLEELEIKKVCPSDTIGISNPENIRLAFDSLIKEFPSIEFGAHLHATPDSIVSKLKAAYEAGCIRFDGAIKGYGGCPMATDELTGNMATEVMVEYFTSIGMDLKLDKSKFASALALSANIFPL